MRKPGLLLITRNLPPLLGGMERLNQHLMIELASEFQMQVCCPSVCAPSVPSEIKDVRTAPLRPLPGFLAVSAFNSIAAARRSRPQLVLAGSGLTAPLALAAAAASKAKSAAYLHGLDIAANHRLYQQLWVRQFSRLDLVIVNSRSTATLAEQAGVEASRIRIVHPGTALPPWQPELGAEFRQRLGLGVRPVLLSVGRLTQRKGLFEFIQEVMPALVRAAPDVYLAVVGDDPAHSLKGDAGQRARIATLVNELGLSRNVGLLGPLDDAALRTAFFAASALIFPVLDLRGDTEGFGMVAVEAAAHGVTTVAFSVGGVADAVSDPVSGKLLPSGDYPAMARCLSDILDRGEESDTVKLARRKFAEQFEWSRFGQKVRALCAGVIAPEV